jgi:signal transduction histidine kinase
MDESQLRVDLDLLKQALSKCRQERDKAHPKAVHKSEAVVEQRDSLPLHMSEDGESLRRSEANLATCISLLEVKDSEIAKLTAEVAELKALGQQKEDYVAALAHDLKNPLLGSVRVLELLSTGVIPVEDQSGVLQVALRSHKNLLSMIWNIIDVYRNEAGALLPVMEPTDIGVLLGECLEEFAMGINDKGLKIKKAFDAELPAVQSDCILLRRVFMNMVDNAVKFSPEGGVLSLSVGQEDNQLIISIKDSGKGLSQSQVEQIFNRFWQTDSGRKYSVGCGLGLYSAKQIIESMNGRLECSSIEHRGAEFKVYLNLVEGQAASVDQVVSA